MIKWLLVIHSVNVVYQDYCINVVYQDYYVLLKFSTASPVFNWIVFYFYEVS